MSVNLEMMRKDLELLENVIKRERDRIHRFCERYRGSCPSWVSAELARDQIRLADDVRQAAALRRRVERMENHGAANKGP